MSEDLSRLLRDYAQERERAAHEVPGDRTLASVRRRAARRRAATSGTAGVAAVAVVALVVVGAGTFGTAAPATVPPAVPADPTGEPTVPPEDADDGATATPAAGADADAADAARSGPRGPLEEYAAQADAVYDAAAERREEMAREEVVAACMAAAGFEYVPHVPSGDGPSRVPEADLVPGTVEFARLYGYGFAVGLPDDLEAAITGIPADPASGQREPDPNEAIRAALGEAEAAAYDRALDGEDSDADPAGAHGDDVELYGDAGGPPDWSERGCRGEAVLAVPYRWDVAKEEFPDVERALANLEGLGMDDTRVAALEVEWASCMADAGHAGMTAQYQAYNRVWDRTDAVEAEVMAEEGYPGEVFASLELLDVPSDEIERIAAVLDDRLAEVREYELDIALADATCLVEIGYYETRREVNHEYQQAFVDTHRDELDRWLASWES